MLSSSGGVWLSSGLLVIRRVAVLFNWFSHFSLTAATTSDLQILSKVNNLYPTEDGKASEEAHSASYQSQLGFQCHLQIIYNSTRNFKSHRPTSPLFQITPVLNNNIQPNLFHNVYGKIEGTQSTHLVTIWYSSWTPLGTT